ncbi:MAG: VPLPA-CTERM sorting domain-containing protein [Pikeienuella sp.]
MCMKKLCVVTLFMAPGLMSPHVALAERLTIDFDHYQANAGQPEYCGKVGNVGYCDRTKYMYGNTSPDVLLGDNDWNRAFDFTADAGTYFGARQLDLSGTSNVMRTAAGCDELDSSGIDCSDQGVDSSIFARFYERNPSRFEAVESDVITITGYRDGAEVASQSLRSQASAGASNTVFGGVGLALGAGFSAIDRLVIDIDPGYSNTRIYPLRDGYFHGCAGSAIGYVSMVCNFAQLDNLEIDSDVGAPSPVPLPASAWLLGGALGGLGGWRRLTRRARAV